MKANPNFNKPAASCPIWASVIDGVRIVTFRLYHQETMNEIAALHMSDGTIPSSRNAYTIGIPMIVPKAAPSTPILTRSDMRRMPWINAA